MIELLFSYAACFWWYHMIRTAGVLVKSETAWSDSWDRYTIYRLDGKPCKGFKDFAIWFASLYKRLPILPFLIVGGLLSLNGPFVPFMAITVLFSLAFILISTVFGVVVAFKNATAFRRVFMSSGSDIWAKIRPKKGS